MDLGGAGPPFVLVHGYTGSSDDFAHVVEPLTASRRVILVDQLGHGDSPRRDEYSFRMLTESLIDFLLEIVGEPVDLLGHSMGGRTVLPIAVERPALLRSLVLMDTWADPPDRSERLRGYAELLDLPEDEAIDALRHYQEPPTPEAALIENVWGSAWVEANEAASGRVDPVAVVHLGREVFGERVSLLRDATNVICPTTVLVGELDLVFIGPSERLASHIPGAELVVLNGAYHSPQLTHPAAWVAALERHLARPV